MFWWFLGMSITRVVLYIVIILIPHFINDLNQPFLEDNFKSKAWDIVFI